MSDNLHTDSRERVLAGIKKGVDAAKITIGPKGANVLIEHDLHPGYQIVNDGITVINSIYLEDPVERMGLSMLKEAVGRHNRTGGDGSTTNAIVLGAIIEEGQKALESCSPMELKASLEECLPIIEASIVSQTKEITVDEVGKVASISAEDENLGAMIQEIYQKIGKEGILYPDLSKTFEDHYTLSQGVKVFGAGYASPYMADVDEKTQAFLNAVQFKSPRLLLVKQKLNDAKKDLERIFGLVNGQGHKDIVIFCDEFEPGVVSDLVVTRLKNNFRAVLVKMPTLWKDHWYDDLAKLTGATVIDNSAGLSLKNVQLSHLGTCEQIIIEEAKTGKEYNTFLDGTLNVSEHIKALESAGFDDDKIRAARLNTKTARLFVGAHSDTALRYRSLKLEDARNAAWQALHGGVVKGGGGALLEASKVLPDTVGGRILSAALKAPTAQICANAGHSDMGLGDDFTGTAGYDAKNDKFVPDMFDVGIVDSAAITKSVVRNAISVSATVLTHRGAITLPPREQTPVPTQ